MDIEEYIGHRIDNESIDPELLVKPKPPAKRKPKKPHSHGHKQGNKHKSHGHKQGRKHGDRKHGHKDHKGKSGKHKFAEKS